MNTTSEPVYEYRPVMFGDNPIQFVFLWMLVPFGFGLTLFIPNGLWFLGLIPSAIGLLALGAWYLGTLTNNLLVTERHIRHRKGLLSKNVKEVAVHKVRSVEVDQSFIQRMTNVGTVRIYTAGDIPEIVLGGLPSPQLIREAVAKHDNFD